MNMKSKVDNKQAELFSEHMNERLKQVLTDVTMNAKGSMQLRIKEGKGLDDQPMKAYTKAYAKKKIEAGRSGKRDLMSVKNPQMLRSIHFAGIRQEGDKLVGVVTIAGKRNQLVALYNQKIDPWFGWSPNDQAEIKESMKEQLAQALGD